MKGENLPAITEIIAKCINRLLRDFGVPVPILGVAIVAMKLQELLRDVRVPIPISRRIYGTHQNVYKFEFKKSTRALESPQKKLRPVQTVSWEHTGHRDKNTRYRDEKNAYHWTEPSRATGRPKSNPNSQSNRKLTGTEGGNQTESPKTSSVSQTSLETATITIRIQALFRDTEVPASFCWKVLKMYKNVCKIKLKKSNC